MLRISPSVSVPDAEIVLQGVKAQGSGGQNVNKVSSAIHLFFDVRASSLPEDYKQRLLDRSDHRITEQGTVVIKAQESRSQESNREAALRRLQQLIQEAVKPEKRRRETRPTKGSKERRLRGKARTSQTKSMRRSPSERD